MLDYPPAALDPASGADRVMVVSGTPPGPVDPGPQVSRSESSDHDAQASSRGEPPPEIAAFQGPVPESPESAPMDAQVALARSFVMVAMAGDTLDAEPAVYYHQGSDFVLLDMLKNQLAYLPDLGDLGPRPSSKMRSSPGESDPEEEERLRTVPRKHRMIFLEERKALPPPARGVVCDLDVGAEKPISMRSRRIPADLLSKVYELLKRLLETGLIEYSNSEWASAIVLVMKKNGTDVRLCIDYRLVNQLVKLMNYPLSLIDELMSNFATTMWFMTLDMASGFWAGPVTARAQLISAVICPLGHFQWKHMPFGLKNAPLVYQQLLDNCLWGFVRLPPDEERLVGPEVLEFLGISPEDPVAQESQGTEPRGAVVSKTSTDTVFHQNRVAPEQMGPVLSRSSYIDDIIYGALSWDDLCKTLNALLYRLRVHSGQEVQVPRARHQLGWFFLGSLNYYAKFIEDLPVLAATLYEISDEQLRSGRDLEKPRHAFKILKDRLVSTPLLQHPDPGRQYVIILHANPWAISAVLGQDYDGTILPVRFVGRPRSAWKRSLATTSDTC
ncbi:LOW QUALITY PROTEIN: reverse transcriptase [Phytophthora megakarya]|uniref:Reverse transcriptase n=1 Tax=Phytophthora megakarya TaxID=4795 RepID=A0A225UNU3_9STRA|nr:LOW QUALITY PROTEIN: reverse transcriptase [Phytophthora megakarya]